MAPFFVILLIGIFLMAMFSLFVNSSPAAIITFFRRVGPILVMILGAGLLLLGRFGIGMPLLAMGGSWLYRQRGVTQTSHSSQSQTSTVRSAWLEMELDHDTGDLNGVILTGPLEGQVLSDLDENQVLEVYRSLRDDAESAGLMEAYLDRRIPLWREHTDSSASAGHGQSSSTGPMSKEEAYQVLGLSQGASAADIKAAHRRLMKAVHPDSGGSTFLAARINEAKQTLLD